MTELAAPAAPEQRLHPLSWLFVLLAQLRQFILPLVALLFFGERDQYALWSLLGVGVLALLSVWRYFTYRYRVEDDSLVIRSGLLHRHLRQIPFARIHNVALHQSPLHRMFDVAEVRLESAGGRKPEAQMQVLKLSDAMALESLVRHRGAAVAVPVDGQPTYEGFPAAADAGATLLRLPPMEVLRLGLVSNRGLLVLGGGFAAISQFDSKIFSTLFEQWGQSLFGWADAHHFGARDYVLAAASLALALVLLLRLFSIVLALLQFFGFHLHENGRRLTVERGLLTRLRTSVPRRRIQAWTLDEGLMHRVLKRRSLRIDTAVGEQAGQQQRTLRDLAPIATPQACDELVRHLLPQVAWPPSRWQPLHAMAWLRLALPGVLFALFAASVLCWRFGAWGLLALAWLPFSVVAARLHAKHAGYACEGELVAVHGGWWTRHWRFAEIDKLQALRLAQSPLDRLYGMATLSLDTAGAGALGPPLRMHYLPQADARALFQHLGVELARRKLRW
jgi:putative membrane protein